MTTYETTGEAARRLGVTLQTIRRWIEAGKLDAKRLVPGGHWRIPVDSTVPVGTGGPIYGSYFNLKGGLLINDDDPWEK